MFKPPVVAKQDGALKFGILGAANIAPMALILPAKSHPEVIVHAVAARDKTRATTFAKEHGIPVVRDSYDYMLNDPDIDVVYIPLPSGLHFEWTLKALAKGKHVLLEKPSTGNADQTETLFHHRLLSRGPTPPVLMEAFHARFAPAWRLFLSTLDPPNISHILGTSIVPFFVAKDDDIRFNYDIGGGALLDLGTYPVAAIRDAFGTEPIECTEAQLTRMAPPREKCDHTFHAKLSFPNGGVGEVNGGMRASATSFSLKVTVTHQPVAAPEEEKEKGIKVTRTRKVIFHDIIFSQNYHRIDVVDEFEATRGSKTTKKYSKTEHKKAYAFREMGVDQPGEPFWSTYRHMLEQFVNRVKGREGTGIFISHEDSIAQARALDMIYNKSGLGPRPSSNFRPDDL
ncbi:NAD(P)-binding protein [Thozetella sp. PMI_491]|nr:NAD(P)-binding protein [Thozetella sp. PMI_491]